MIDELPYLTKASPALPSLLQRALDPRGVARRSQARLLLCGSAMSVMGRLLSGSAPLRGRASLELIVRPLHYRDAARFWGIDDPRLAVLVHAIVGGTPAYRREFVADDAPSSLKDFDEWVLRTVLNPQTPLFREARYLLAEETELRDAAPYHAVLDAIATGYNTRGGIASAIGRKSTDIGHPLSVLEDTQLVARHADPPNRTQIEVDVVVLAPEDPGRPRRVLSLGEAKWDTTMNRGHVERLRRARDLLSVKGFDTASTVLTCYSTAGFDPELRSLARMEPRILLVDLATLYG